MAVHTAQLLPGVADLHPQIRIALVIADFNPDITHTIAEKNTSFLHAQGFQHVDHYHVPGAFELPSLTKQIAQDGVYNLIITIGCLIKGETPHFDVIAQAATQ